MGNSFSGKDFKNLRDSWYGKLAEQGFEDIENSKREDSPLKAWDSIRIKKKYSRETAEYYLLAERFLHSHHFIDAISKEIWTLHSDGFSLREIAVKINIKYYVCQQTVFLLKRLMLHGR